MARNKESHFRPIGTLLPKIELLPPDSDLTPTELPPSSSTTGDRQPKTSSNEIGQLRSEIIVDTLRGTLSKGNPIATTEALLASLKRLVSLSLDCPATDDPKTTFAKIGWKVTGGDIGGAKEVGAVAMTPASRHLLVAALTKLRLLTISRSADTEEMALILAAYADALAEHPGDVVLKAIGDWPKNHKFWPSLAELTDYAKQTDEDRYLLAEALGLR